MRSEAERLEDKGELNSLPTFPYSDDNEGFQERWRSSGATLSSSAPLDAAAVSFAAHGAVEDSETQAEAEGGDPHPLEIEKEIPWRLYTSHFLSTWNSRSFEFGATLFLASIYPDTIQPLSIYALVRSASAIVFAPYIGQTINEKGRLAVVRFSIVAGRTAVIVSALGFWGLNTYRSLSSSAMKGVFAALMLLSCLEKIASVLNLVAVERDWVVVVSHDDEPRLQKLNARMRRIDLICKLAGPLIIALIDGASTEVAIWFTLGTNVVSMPLEYFLIAKVYKLVPALQAAKNLTNPSNDNSTPPDGTVIATPREQNATSTPPTGTSDSAVSRSWRYLIRGMKVVIELFRFYFKHSACLPSFSLAILYLTVLSFGGQMVTYLIAAGFNSFYIALVRTLSVVFEISATWIAPRLMARIGAARAGMWFLSWQMLWLGATVSFFWGST